MKRISKVWIGIAAIIVVAAGAWLLSGMKKERPIDFEKDKVKQVNIRNSITATGTIEPVTSVTVGTQVSGIVSKLYVDYNSVVKKDRSLPNLTRQTL